MTAIRVELQLADGTFTAGMLRAGQSLAQFNQQILRANPQLQNFAANGRPIIQSMQRMDASAKGFLSTLRDVSIVAGVVSMGLSAATRVANGWVGEIIRINAEMERLTFQMRAMSTAPDPFKDAAQNVQYLREQAMQTPYSLKTLTNAFVKLKATGTDPTAGSLRSIVDGVAAFGGTDEALGRIVLGITQMSGKAVIQMEELRQQLGESMPGAMQLMARGMGLTVAQLTKHVSTGTLEAKSALELFYAEIDRTYGGAAQRMMQSFTGQISQMHTSFQMLVTDEGGTQFFEQVKAQLVDINRFLASDMAKVMARDVGQALGQVVVAIRASISTIWEWRDGMVSAAKVAAAGFLLLAGLRGLGALQATMLATIATSKILWTNLAAAWANIALGASGMRSLQTATLGAQFAAMGLYGAVRSIGVALISLAPMIFGVGAAVVFLADRFGFLKDNTKDAYDELVKYGGESRAQTQQIVNDRITQLEMELSQLESIKDARGRDLADQQAAIAEVKAELADVRAQAERLIREATGREDEKALSDLELSLSSQMEALRASYNTLQQAAAKHHEDEVARAEVTGRAISDIDRELQASFLENAKTLNIAQRSLYDEQLRIQREALHEAEQSGDQGSARLARLMINNLTGRWTEAYEEFQRLQQGFADPRHLDAGASDQTKASERAQTVINNLYRDVANLKGELSGASGAMAELEQRIANGDFGSIKEGGDEVRALHDELRAATAAKEALDDLMQGQRRAERDLEKVRMDNIERRAELQERAAGRELSGAERMLLRLRNGYYEGLGPIENIRTAIENVVDVMNRQGNGAAQLANIMQSNTFGDETVAKIDGVNDAMGRLAQTIAGVGGALGSISFAGFGEGMLNGIGQPGGFFMGSGGTKGMLDLIASVESKGDYNATLDNGRWTGGPKNLVGMTLNQVRQLQAGMRTPANRALYGNGKGSSALGRYQIVGQTLDGLIKEMGLTGNELYDQEMQDAMARHLLARRRGEGNAGLRAEWAGLKNVTDAQIAEAMRISTTGPTRDAAAMLNAPAPAPLASATPQTIEWQNIGLQLTQQQETATNNLVTALEDQASVSRDLDNEEAALMRQELLEKLIADTKGAGAAAEESGKKYGDLVSLIQQGKLGESTNIAAPEYAELLRAARTLDETNKRIADHRKLDNELKREGEQLDEKSAELARSIAENQSRVADPNYQAQSQALNSLITDLDVYVAKAAERHGQESAEYAAAVARRSQILQQHRLMEATDEQAKLATERRDLETSLMTQTQIRQREMERQLSLLDGWVTRARAAGMSEVDITEFVEQQKAAIRGKYALEMSPMEKQFKEWGDLQGNLAQASARWMDSMTTGISDMLMGTGDLRSMVQGITKDLLNMSVKNLFSSLFSSGGGAAPAGPGVGSLFKKLFPVAHTGGIAGSSALKGKRASAAAFINAPKFHTGGIVGGGPKLHRTEVPIVAQKGEGIFTPEQMDHLGGFSQANNFEINAPISVHGSAGTPEQNSDLAAKMAKQMEGSMRGVIADEIRKQSRAGNYLNKRG